jgi:hypothetical protein
MHAKIYLSESGAVVGSANASSNALNNESQIESGIYVSPGSKAFQEIEKDFEKRWHSSDQVDSDALEQAPIYNYHKPVNGTKEVDSATNLEGATILELLHDPSQLKGVYFVISSEGVSEEVREKGLEEARKKETELGKNVAAPGDVKNSEHNEGQVAKGFEVFSGWDIASDQWPALFFSIYIGPRKGVVLQKCKHFHHFKDEEDSSSFPYIFVAKTLEWGTHGRAFGGTPKIATNKKCAEEVRCKLVDIFHQREGQILSSNELANILRNPSKVDH